MICIPIIANTVEDALRDMAAASKLADVIELRLDYIKNPDLRLLLKRRTKPVILTNRPVREGGKFDGSEEERISLLKLAMQLQADFVDIEHDSIHKIGKDVLSRIPRGKTRLIVSYHNFYETPGDVAAIYQKLSQSGADIVKIVTYATDISDNIRIYRLLQDAQIPLISFCMGEYGIMSRILYKRFGSYLTFASLRRGKESAPGQISIHEFLNTYQALRQDKNTAIYGLIGNPVSHSIGPIIHNTLFKEKNLNSIYVPFKVDRVNDFIRAFRELDIKGYSVTIPHKEAVIPFLDAIDPIARKIGAVNTILNRDGCLTGYNTDCGAAVDALKNVYRTTSHYVSPIGRRTTAVNDDCLKGKKVILLGAGGAARAIAFGLKDEGAKITIVNRNYERAQSLAREVGCHDMRLDDLQVIEGDILINATPVGMFPEIDKTPVTGKKLRPGMIVFDTIYNPAETKLLREARVQGCKVVGGLPMFVYQAAAQFTLWTGETPPFELIEKIAYENLTYHFSET
jgi:3-dehydroquinate dehydratase/shikimate dehydrogenase